VGARTPACSFITRETVATDTPACAATALMETVSVGKEDGTAGGMGGFT
jgi:hypothetical protein